MEKIHFIESRLATADGSSLTNLLYYILYDFDIILFETSFHTYNF